MNRATSTTGGSGRTVATGTKKSGTQIEGPKTSEIVAEEVGTSRATVERANFNYNFRPYRPKGI